MVPENSCQEEALSNASLGLLKKDEKVESPREETCDLGQK